MDVLSLTLGPLLLAFLAATFFGTVGLGERIGDRLNTAPITLPARMERRRPRLLAGKWLVALWFATAAIVLLPVELPPLIGLLAFGLAQFLVVSYERSLAQRPVEELDERERALQRSIYVGSYRVLAGVVAAGGVALMLVDAGVIDLRLTPPEVGDVFLVGVLAVWAIPSLVHAWLDPRPALRLDDDPVLVAER